ncbi:hypothetical protein I5L01_15510, partial [Erythrobacter sp. YJ-T3-07]|uniref:condensation domain-containing protein n=1 Tax=Erythrobacter sp. YJ-T3-07 TaxID=2793063 RepID=UPI0018D2F5C1
LVRYDEDRHLWLHRYHHLIIDGYGVPMAGAAIIEAYNRLLSGKALDLTPAPSYLGFLHAEQRYLSSPRFERDVAFWRARYSTLPPALLPATHVHAQGKAPDSGKQILQVSRETFDRIRTWSASHGLTENHFFLALVHSYFSRVSDVDEIVIGVPVHNRTTPAQ